MVAVVGSYTAEHGVFRLVSVYAVARPEGTEPACGGAVYIRSVICGVFRFSRILPAVVHGNGQFGSCRNGVEQLIGRAHIHRYGA